jgi:hypothetical protein
MKDNSMYMGNPERDGVIIGSPMVTFIRTAGEPLKAGMIVAYRPDHPEIVYPYPRVLTRWQRFWQRFQAPVIWLPMGVVIHDALRGQQVTVVNQMGDLTAAVKIATTIETKEGEPFGYVYQDGKMFIGKKK